MWDLERPFMVRRLPGVQQIIILGHGGSKSNACIVGDKAGWRSAERLQMGSLHRPLEQFVIRKQSAMLAPRTFSQPVGATTTC